MRGDIADDPRELFLDVRFRTVEKLPEVARDPGIAHQVERIVADRAVAGLACKPGEG